MSKPDKFRKIASRRDMDLKELPELRETISYQQKFSLSEYQKILRGFLPESSEDRWFIFAENDWVFFHRSWTGEAIFWFSLARLEDRYQVAEAWACRDRNTYDPGEYNQGKDADMIRDLVREYLLA